ncbi:hypothetical protein [Actinoallomurus sp. NPDC052274]|uniref:hypothetical protein n=1 Tax=Actinoallomurus sp. NPDC052274 TaxID=3155420 RepID=UPI00342CC6EF
MTGMSGAGIDGMVTGGLAAIEVARRGVVAHQARRGQSNDKTTGDEKGRTSKKKS